MTDSTYSWETIIYDLGFDQISDARSVEQILSSISPSTESDSYQGILINSPNGRLKNDSEWEYQASETEQWKILSHENSEASDSGHLPNQVFLDKDALIRLRSNETLSIDSDPLIFHAVSEISNLFAQETQSPFDLLLDPSVTVSNPSFVDIDNDGDLDVLTGTRDKGISFSENIGTKNRGLFSKSTSNAFGIESSEIYLSPAFADLDQDGDFDAFLGDVNGSIHYFENIGTKESPQFDKQNAFQKFGINSLETINSSNGWIGKSNPTFVDLDLDGDLDLFFGLEGENTLYYQENLNGSFGDLIINSFGLSVQDSESNFYYLTPSFIDFDHDTDFDAIIGDANGDLHYLENTGTSTSPSFVSRGKNLFGLRNVQLGLDPSDVHPSIADIDSDGDSDLFLGTRSGSIYFFENLQKWRSGSWRIARPDDLSDGITTLPSSLISSIKLQLEPEKVIPDEVIPDEVIPDEDEPIATDPFISYENTGLETKAQVDSLDGLCDRLTPGIIQKTEPTLFQYFSKKCIQSLSDQVVTIINKQQFQYLEPSYLKSIKSSQVKFMREDIFSNVSTKQFKMMKGLMREMSFAQFSYLPQEVYPLLKTHIKYFKKMVNGLSGAQAASLHKEIIPFLKGSNSRFFKKLGDNFKAQDIIPNPNLFADGLISTKNIKKIFNPSFLSNLQLDDFVAIDVDILEIISSDLRTAQKNLPSLKRLINSMTRNEFQSLPSSHSEFVLRNLSSIGIGRKIVNYVDNLPSPSTLSAIPFWAIKYIKSSLFASATASHINKLSYNSNSNLTASQVKKIPADAFSAIVPRNFSQTITAAINFNQLSYLSEESLKKVSMIYLPVRTLGSLTAEQVSVFPAKGFNEFYKIMKVNREALKGLSKDQVSKLRCNTSLVPLLRQRSEHLTKDLRDFVSSKISRVCSNDFK